MELLASAVSTVVVLAVFMGPWALLAVAASRFGIDSRPGIGDTHVGHPRGWA